MFVLSFESLREWCQRQGYEFAENVELGQLAIHHQLLGEPAPLMILPQPPRGMVMFVMRQPFVVPEDRRAAMVEAAGLLNSMTVMGAWVQNPENREVYFRVTVPALDIQYTDAGVLHVARIVVSTSERAAAALQSVALHGAEPAAAIAALPA